MKILDNKEIRILSSKSYNYIFNKKSGVFIRWGQTKEEDPEYAPFPEILDIEVSTICNGIPNVSGIESPCAFCYKSNTKHGSNMSFDTYKTIIDKMKFVTQVAFGADAKAESNPDLIKMMEYTRSIGIIPNITVANLSDSKAKELASICGAMAVSRYENKNICYDTVNKLTDNGLQQCNIHQLVSNETKDQIWETLNDIQTDPRLAKLNAIVLLSLKQVGRGSKYTKLTNDDFKAIIDYCFEHEIRFGMDSCSQKKFVNSIKECKDFDKLVTLTDPCESTCFSSYINVEGLMYPCSFCENSKSFPTGIDIAKCENFIKDAWMSESIKKWRSHLLKSRKTSSSGCPVYDV